MFRIKRFYTFTIDIPIKSLKIEEMITATLKPMEQAFIVLALNRVNPYGLQASNDNLRYFRRAFVEKAIRFCQNNDVLNPTKGTEIANRILKNPRW